MKIEDELTRIEKRVNNIGEYIIKHFSPDIGEELKHYAYELNCIIHIIKNEYNVTSNT